MTAALEWVRVSDTFHRSADGRFDLFFVADRGGWVVYDWDAGRKVYEPALPLAKAWCQRRLL